MPETKALSTVTRRVIHLKTSLVILPTISTSGPSEGNWARMRSARSQSVNVATDSNALAAGEKGGSVLSEASASCGRPSASV
eukprot:465790-Prymnesium_polylepis.1